MYLKESRKQNIKIMVRKDMRRGGGGVKTRPQFLRSASLGAPKGVKNHRGYSFMYKDQMTHNSNSLILTFISELFWLKN